MPTSDAPIIINPPAPSVRAVIWLHGLGADGYDFKGLEAQLGLPADHGIRFIYPHAPLRPVTINGGYVMRAWYDIYSLEKGMRDDEAGLEASAGIVQALIDEQVREGIALEHILLAGFSQGGAVALYTTLRNNLSLAGVLALSTYLPLASQLRTTAGPEGRAVPVWMAHGEEDPVVPLTLGQESMDILRDLGVAVEWHTYDMPHSVCPEEIMDIGRWLRGRLLS